MPVALAGLTEPAEGEHPVPRVLLRYSHPRANTWHEPESWVCSHTANDHVGAQELGRETGSKALLMVPQRREGQIPAITCNVELKGSFGALKVNEVICGTQCLQIQFCATRREESLMTLRNHLRKICVD